MLALLFYISDVKYIIKCEKIREIAPVVVLKTVPHAPDYFAGYFNYRGEIVPVIDLCRLIQGTPCRARLSSRIILVDYRARGGASYILGVMAEQVTETIKKPGDAFQKPGIRSKEAPYLGGIVMDNGEMIQYIDLNFLPNCIQFLPAGEDGESDDPMEY